MQKKKDEIIEILEKKGITVFTECKAPERASGISNTYAFEADGKLFLLDTSCGLKRRRELKKFIGKRKNTGILCTHYHNDHIANNGSMASGNSRIYYHFNAATKTGYLRTNGTGQILEMSKNMSLPHFLGRLKMFSRTQAGFVLFLSKISHFLPYAVFFAASYLYSLKTIGMIYPGKSKIRFLWEKYRKKIKLENFQENGWIIAEGLYAFAAPGHCDDHLIFYFEPARILFAGDCLNFLTPNDIQFGDIKDTFESIDLIRKLVKAENIEILASGHYLPVSGTDRILKYIDDSKNSHFEMFNTVKSVIASKTEPLDLETILAETMAYQSDTAQKAAKLTFPRSTLIFLDVYILKTLQTLGYKRGSDGLWRKCIEND